MLNKERRENMRYDQATAQSRQKLDDHDAEMERFRRELNCKIDRMKSNGTLSLRVRDKELIELIKTIMDVNQDRLVPLTLIASWVTMGIANLNGEYPSVGNGD